MFKNGTIALAMITALTSASAGAVGVDCSMYEEKIANAFMEGADQSKMDGLKRLREECRNQESSEVGDCNRVESNYNAAVKELRDACDSMGLKTSSQTGSIGCSYNIDQCRCAGKNLSEADKRYLECDKVDTSKMRYCPQVTEAAKDRMEKRREKTDGQLEKLRDKMRGLDDEAGKTDDKVAEARRSARQARLAAEKEYAQAIGDLAREKNQKEQERIQKMSEFEEKMQASRTALRAQPLKDRNADRKLEATKSQIYLQCVSQAQVAVNALQTDAVARVREGSYNRGTSNQIFMQVGLTDRQNWQREVNKRVAWCMASPETRTAQDQANVQLTAERDGNKVEAEDAQNQLDMLKRQMDQIQVGCTGGAKAANGEVVQSQACRDQSDANTRLAQVNKTREDAHRAAQEDENDAVAAAKKAEDTLKRKKGELANEIAGQQMLMGQMDAADTADAAYPTPSTGGTSQERAKELSSKYAQAIDHALRTNRCCEKSGTNISNGSCNGAKTFLGEHGLTDTSSSQSTNASRRPPSESGRGATRAE